MYLVDTDVISEARKGIKANSGVKQFFSRVSKDGTPIYISVITLGELRRGVETIRHRGDNVQATKLERWLDRIMEDYGEAVLDFDEEMAQVWGRLRVPHHENALDKQIAATALIHDLIVVTRNIAHFKPTGARLLNPFE